MSLIVSIPPRYADNVEQLWQNQDAYKFQFLLGTLITQRARKPIQTQIKFQFLLGTLITILND